MKQLMTLVAAIFMVVSLSACSSRAGSAGLGAVGGAAAGAGAYEYNLNKQMNELEDDYKAGKIDQREYEIRKKQIEDSSILK
jgi:hypothetical protein